MYMYAVCWLSGPQNYLLSGATMHVFFRVVTVAEVSKLPRMQLGYKRRNHRLSKVARIKWLILDSLYA